MNDLYEKFLILNNLSIDLSFLQINTSLNPDLILNKLDNLTLSDDILDNINLDYGIEKFYSISKWLNPILITIITLLGLYGNFVSLVIFSSQSFNKQSIKILRMYLIFLSTSDLLVLIFHYIDFTFISWTNLIKSRKFCLNLMNQSRIFCKLIPFLRNLFRTMSIYCLVLLSIHRIYSLYYPMVKSRWSNLKFNKTVIFLIFIFAVLINWHNLILNDLVGHYKTNQIFCSINRNYFRYQFIFDFKYIIVSILIPIIIIIGISFVLYTKIRFVLKNRSYYVNGIVLNRNERRLPSDQSVKSAYLTLILSKWFVILHLPYTIIWSLLHIQLRKESSRVENFLLFLIYTKPNENENKKYLLKGFLNFFEVLTILNYSVNFFIFIVKLSLFKKIYKKKFFFF